MFRQAHYLLLAAAIAAGNLCSVQAFYDCAMSGQRKMVKCCCASFAGCPDTSMAAAEKAPGVSLRNVCCSVTYEKTTAAGLAARSASENAWKRTLDSARLIPALFERLIPEFSGVRATRGHCPRRDETLARGSDPPLFLLHCAFLI